MNQRAMRWATLLAAAAATLAFRAEDDDTLRSPFDRGLVRFSAFVKPVDEIAHVLEHTQRLVDVGGANNREVFEGSGRGFGMPDVRLARAECCRPPGPRSDRVQGCELGVVIERSASPVPLNEVNVAENAHRGVPFEIWG